MSEILNLCFSSCYHSYLWVLNWKEEIYCIVHLNESDSLIVSIYFVGVKSFEYQNSWHIPNYLQNKRCHTWGRDFSIYLSRTLAFNPWFQRCSCCQMLFFVWNALWFCFEFSRYLSFSPWRCKFFFNFELKYPFGIFDHFI